MPESYHPSLRGAVPESTSLQRKHDRSRDKPYEQKNLEKSEEKKTPKERQRKARVALEHASPEAHAALKEDIASKTREALERAMFDVVWGSLGSPLIWVKPREELV